MITNPALYPLIWLGALFLAIAISFAHRLLAPTSSNPLGMGWMVTTATVMTLIWILMDIWEIR